MSQPSIWTRLKNFTQYALDNPSAPYNAADHDAEFNGAQLTVSELRTNIGLIQRDDGKLKNGSVHPDALSAATRLLISDWNPRGAWAAATNYALKDVVESGGIWYVCIVAHTSGASFAVDLAAAKWMAINLDMAALAAPSGSSLVGFIQSGTGATARTAQAKMRDFVSVKDFGAVGDGTTDDTAAITAALAASKFVFFPAGTFRISSAITLSTGHVLLGCGRQDTVISNFGAVDAFTNAAGIRGAYLRGMKVLGQTGSRDGFRFVANFGHVQFVDMLFDVEAKAINAEAGNGVDIYMQDVRAEGGTTAFAFSAAVALNTITAINCYANGSSVGFDLAGVSEATLIGCSSDNNTTYGYQLGGRVTLMGCTAEANDQRGFSVIGTGQITFINCYTGSQLLPFNVTAAADVTFINIRSSSTPSGNALELGAGATGKNMLIGHALDAAISINASAKLTRFDAETFQFNADTNLYRSAANVLKTDDTMHIVGDAIVQQGVAASQVQIGGQGPGGQAGFRLTTSNISWNTGSGTPEGAIAAPVGSLWTRTDGGAVTTLYVKESGAGNTGWVAK